MSDKELIAAMRTEEESRHAYRTRLIELAEETIRSRSALDRQSANIMEYSRENNRLRATISAISSVVDMSEDGDELMKEIHEIILTHYKEREGGICQDFRNVF